MEVNKAADEDCEVFIGEVTEQEMSCPTFHSRRRTTVYLPGISRPDSHVSFYQEHTEDGTLIFSFEDLEVSGQEPKTVEGSVPGSESSKSELLCAETKLGQKLTKDRSMWLNSHACLPSQGSDTDSGFGSVSDCTSVTSLASRSSLGCESDAEPCSQKAKIKLDKEKQAHSDDRSSRYGHTSSYIEKVQHESPLMQSVRVESVNQAHLDSPKNRRTSCRKMSSTGCKSSHRVSATLNKELQIKLPKCEVPSGPHKLADFPVHHSDSGCVSPTTSIDCKVLPMKRKIAQRSLSVKLNTNLKADTEKRCADSMITKIGNSSHMLYVSDDGLGHAFDVFQVSRKLQKLDIGCDERSEAEQFRVSQTQGKLAAVDTNTASKTQSILHHDFVPEIPNFRISAFQSSHKKLPCQSSPENVLHAGFDEIDIVPSYKRTKMHLTPVVPFSKRTEMDLSPVVPSFQRTQMELHATHLSRGYNIFANVIPVEKHLTDSSKLEPSTPTCVDKHVQMDLTSSGSPDLVSSLSSPSGISSQSAVHYPVPASMNNTSVLKPLGPQSLLQTVNEEQRLRSKYGNLVRRKPMTLQRRDKENEIERQPLSGMLSRLNSFEEISATSATLLEDSRAAMTRINTLINGETRHTLMDPTSSPALLTYFPPPKRASRVSWSDNLAEDAASCRSPTQSPVVPRRSILQQRPDSNEFPFSKDPPSPIILTRRRLPKFS